MRTWMLPFLMVVVACQDPTRLTPIDPGDVGDWITAKPQQVGLDPDKLELARAYGFSPEFYTHSILVVRDGYLVAEWYAEDVDPETYASSWSIAKSFTATLIGIAIDEGDIASVDVSMVDFVPAWAGSDKAQIKLHDVLTMSSGLDWIEDYQNIGAGANASDVARMVLENDPLGVVFEQPVSHPPGEVWYYSSGDTMLLGHALRQATGKTAADLLQEKLAEPLGSDSMHWWQDATGVTYTYCCLDATARDFAKFGQLYLQKGQWGGQQIVSSAWVAEASAPQAQANPGYGYQWWLNDSGSTSGRWPSLPASTYFALGHDGQYIAIFPDLNMVVVRMGEYILPDTEDWIARDGLFAAGLFSDNLGPTGTRGPEGDWSEDLFFKLFLDAVVE